MHADRNTVKAELKRILLSAADAEEVRHEMPGAILDEAIRELAEEILAARRARAPRKLTLVHSRAG